MRIALIATGILMAAWPAAAQQKSLAAPSTVQQRQTSDALRNAGADRGVRGRWRSTRA